MFTINGFGTRLYGQCDFAADGSYTSTYWIVAAYVPIIPLYSVRVIREQSSLLSDELTFVKTPLYWQQVGRIYLYVTGACGVFLAGVAAIAESPLHEPHRYPVLMLLMVGIALLPAILRRRAKQQQSLPVPPLVSRNTLYWFTLLLSALGGFIYWLAFQAA